MTTERVRPQKCQTMAEIRQGIDELDQHIVTLLAERLRYIEAAARVKQDRDVVRDEWRKADVIAKACETARSHGFSTDMVTKIYDQLIELSIAHEFERFDRLKG
ncbi:MAG: chorismate mutase [Pacificimonas sp.]